MPFCIFKQILIDNRQIHHKNHGTLIENYFNIKIMLHLSMDKGEIYE